MKRILFICHGNICRSPMAEFVMKDLVKTAGLASQFHIESAATSREEIGNPVYPPARRKLAEHGISCEAVSYTHLDVYKRQDSVSSDSEDQLNSFAAQNRYYTELISCKAEWRMVDIYADEGITGTSVAKRDDFQRMMADCRRGLIDQILVKSISRFARNTKDCLQNIRELKELGVNVRFEREGIDTVNVSSELITAIYAAFAQKESESISGNMRWSYQRRMESGTFLPSSMAYGYRLDGRKIVIDPEAALVVSRIFQWFLSGVNKTEIAKRLNEEGVPSGQQKRWYAAAVRYILTNEKYTGDSLWQKTYTLSLRHI